MTQTTGSPSWVNFLFLLGILRLDEPYRGHECGYMIEKIRESLQSFKESEPGHRFKDRYHRRQQSKSDRFDLGVVVCVLGGILIVRGGSGAVPGPGPGWLIVLLGLGLVAGEFRPIAHFMDWAEVRLRRLARWAAGVWTSSPPAVKALIILAILVCAAALGYGAYRLFFGLGSNQY